MIFPSFPAAGLKPLVACTPMDCPSSTRTPSPARSKNHVEEWADPPPRNDIVRGWGRPKFVSFFWRAVGALSSPTTHGPRVSLSPTLSLSLSLSRARALSPPTPYRAHWY